jgi:hypothetical protein
VYALVARIEQSVTRTISGCGDRAAAAAAAAAEKSAQWRMLGWLIVTMAATYALVAIYRWAQEPKVITQTYYCPAKLLKDGSYQFIPGKQCSQDASKIP